MVNTPPSSGIAVASSTGIALRIPPSLFGIATGLGGLSAAWRAAARAYKTSAWIADALLAATVAIFVALLAAQLVKAFVARDRLRAELEDPVQGSLAALGPTSLLLVAHGLAVHSRDVANVLFWIGATAQVGLAVHLAGRWLTTAVPARLVTPAMYLPPVVGNLVAALAAAAIGRGELGWLFFGAAIVAWLVIAAALLSRYLSAGELDPALRPLLGLELAPPAFALLAWQALEGPGPDPTSRALLGFALFVALVLLRLVARFGDVPFGDRWWAFAFPLAALSAATLRLAATAPASIGAALALPLFVAANAAVALIAFRTGVALSRGELLRD